MPEPRSMDPIRPSAKAVIIRDDKLLVIEKSDGEHVFYVVPGGGQQPGVNLVETLKRECQEELGLPVEVGRLLFMREYIGANHQFADKHAHKHLLNFFFACQLQGDPANIAPTQPDELQTGIDWLPIDQLSAYPLFPAILKDLIPRLGEPDLPVYLGDVN